MTSSDQGAQKGSNFFLLFSFCLSFVDLNSEFSLNFFSLFFLIENIAIDFL